MGIAVFAGMLGVTVFGLFLTPVFYVVVRRPGGATVAAASTRSQSHRTTAGAGGGTLIMRTRRFRTSSHRLAALTIAAFGGAGRLRGADRAAPADRSARRRWSAGTRRLFSDQAYDPRWWRQLEDPVLEELERGGARRQSRHPLGAGATRPARAIFDEDRRLRYPRVTAGASVDVREQAQPGFTDEPVRINTYRAGFDAIVGARSLRPRARGDRRRVGQRRKLRGGAAKRAA